MKNKIPKVLIGAPTSFHKRYCDVEFIAHVKAFSYPNKEIYLVDNSPTEEYAKSLRLQGIEVDWINPKGKPLREVMAECNNKIREKALNENFDFVFSLETDQFPPTNILEKLLAYDIPVVSVPYFWGHGANRFLLLRDLERSQKDGGVDEESVSFIDGFFFANGELKQIFACGIGCMLIKREVLEKIEFRIDTEQNTDSHADSFFSQELFYEGFNNMIDTSLLSWHYNSDWGAVVDNY